MKRLTAKIGRARNCVGRPPKGTGEPVEFAVMDDLAGHRFEAVTVPLTWQQYTDVRVKEWLKHEVQNRVYRGGKLTIEVTA